MAQLAYSRAPEAHVEEVFTTDMSVGEILRRSRKHYNLSLYDVERELHIRPPQIEAMENDHFERLPGRVYAIGFIRSYSEYLGLDGNKMVKLYKHQIRGRSNDPALQYPVCASESKLPSMWLVGLSIVGLALGMVLWNAYTHTENTAGPPPIPAVPEHIAESTNKSSLFTTNNSVSVDETSASPAQGTLQSPQASPQPEGIILKVIENSWVEIKGADGRSLVSRVLRQGEQYFIPKREGLLLSLGNASGVRLEINKQDLGQLGPSGEALRDFPLNFDYLKARIENKSENSL